MSPVIGWGPTLARRHQRRLAGRRAVGGEPTRQKGTAMSAEKAAAAIERVDKYTILVDGVRVRATPAQEAQIRSLDADQRRLFLRAIGGDR